MVRKSLGSDPDSTLELLTPGQALLHFLTPAASAGCGAETIVEHDRIYINKMSSCLFVPAEPINTSIERRKYVFSLFV